MDPEKKLQRLKTAKGLGLEVGCGVSIELNPKKKTKLRSRSAILGWEEGNHILLNRPGIANPDFSRREFPCVVRFIRDGNIFGFSSDTLNLSSRTAKFLSVRWPVEATVIRARSHERVAIELSCKVTLPDGTSVTGVMSDLSLGGCSLVIGARLSKTGRIKISFALPDTEEIDDQPIIIRNVSAAEGGTLKYGCQFADAPNEESYALGFYIARQLAALRGGRIAHTTVLMLSQDHEAVLSARHALAPLGCELVGVNGVLELGHRLYSDNPAAVVVSVAGCELPPSDLLDMIKRSPHAQAMKLVLYGADDALKGTFGDGGEIVLLENLSDIGKVIVDH